MSYTYKDNTDEDLQMEIKSTNDGVIKNMTFKEWMKNKQGVNGCAGVE